ncbi:MAG: hypothetical protein MK213_08820 [Planctomycetes bacterium]|nr:hypothetical protein [Planctomycetota bacterium]
MSNEEVLVVTSKLKRYIKETAGMNCAGNVPAALSVLVRQLTDAAIANAAKDRRKTVKDRDYVMPSGGGEE